MIFDLAKVIVIAATLFLLACNDLNSPTEKETAGQVSAPMACITPLSEVDKSTSMVLIEGGEFLMGSDSGYEDEGPAHKVSIVDFWIDRHEVTNDQFSRFVKATGYVTQAEKAPDSADFPNIDPALLMAGSVVFVKPLDLKAGGDITQWWQFVPGASWDRPYGPDSNIAGKGNFPVVQVGIEDAMAYAQWLGRDLPTEAQWEMASRVGREGATYAWGNTFNPDDQSMANTWQGLFPIRNSKKDGFEYASPVGCFPASSNGLYDMIGNVWEWTSDGYRVEHADKSGPRGVGFSLAQSHDPRQPGVPVGVIKGGSYLCAPNYCMRYRPSARHANETGLGAAHLGFRTVLNSVSQEQASAVPH